MDKQANQVAIPENVCMCGNVNIWKYGFNNRISKKDILSKG